MPTTTWNETTIDGVDYWVIDTAKFRIPKEWDPTSNMFIAVGVPDGGVGFFDAIAQGDDGVTPVLESVINFATLPHDDPTPAFASFTLTAPNTYRLNLGLHEGDPGADNVVVLDLNAYGTPVYKKVLVVNATADDLEYQTQLVGDWYNAATIANTPSGNTGYTLASIPVPAQDFDWRPHVEGQSIVTGTGTNVVVDLIARLDNATSGNEVGRAFGSPELSATTHVHPTQVLSSGPPTGSADGYDRIAAGAAATIHLRAERQSGDETFTTTDATTRFRVKVDPVP